MLTAGGVNRGPGGRPTRLGAEVTSNLFDLVDGLDLLKYPEDGGLWRELRSFLLRFGTWDACGAVLSTAAIDVDPEHPDMLAEAAGPVILRCTQPARMREHTHSGHDDYHGISASWGVSQ